MGSSTLNTIDTASAARRFLPAGTDVPGEPWLAAALLHDVGEHEGRPFLVMELLSGESLGSRLDREALEQRYRELGALSAQTIVAYCGSGVSAAVIPPSM